MPALYLVRHAKSAYPEGVDDADRPLSERGARDAVQLGVELAQRCEAPDLVLVSRAARAQQTWEYASQALQPKAVQTESRLYLASPDEFLEVVRATDDGVRTLFLVGHNDGISEFAGRLTKSDVALKTASFAVINAGSPWRSWSIGGATLEETHSARG